MDEGKARQVGHEQFQSLLDKLVEVQRSAVGQEVFGELLARTSLRAPNETSRVDLAAPNPTARRPVDQRAIPQGTVSKAVKALLQVGLLDDGVNLLRNKEGRVLSPLRLGQGFVIAGVHVEQRQWRPTEITVALVGLDTSHEFTARPRCEVLGHGHDEWEEVAEVVYRAITELKRGVDPSGDALQLFGIGIEVGTPVHNGKIMPAPTAYPHRSVDLAGMVRKLFAADDDFDQPVSVVIENDVNALAVLALHEAKNSEPDLVVVSVFDEGVGGGLVMNGRLRRGSKGKAMEIGHLEVGYAPGEVPPPSQAHYGVEADWPQPERRGDAALPPDFLQPCHCGEYGHVDTLATPSRIEGQLRANTAAGHAGAEATPERAVFAQAGSALGRAVAHVCNIANPNRLIIYLPEALAAPAADSAATAYLQSAVSEIRSAFATAGDPDGFLTVSSLPADRDHRAKLGAKAAAVCVLESFIEHALRLDECNQVSNDRPATDHSSAA
ncbi:ROK family protein [Nocardia sp. NPDC050412]|uniref:ROK family protein n=1 Tax=Nocardia sp. NPDC050412 TaxID=3364320 RepID=UPI0037990E58